MHKINIQKYINERCGGKEPVQIKFLKDIGAKNKSKFFCAGGCIRAIFDKNIDFSDIDLFPQTEDDYINLISFLENNYKVKTKKENDYNTSLDLEFIEVIEKEGGENENILHAFKVQIIKFFHLTIEDLFDSFDFTICQFGYYNDNDCFVLGENSMQDLKNKSLVITKVTYPLSTMRRFFKYSNKGFISCSGSLKNFLNQVKQSESPDVNEEPEYID